MIIYKITNKINGKVYIGQTSNTLEKRWWQHCHGTHKHIIARAISKYGAENFKIEQIDVAESQENRTLGGYHWRYYD